MSDATDAARAAMPMDAFLRNLHTQPLDDLLGQLRTEGKTIEDPDLVAARAAWSAFLATPAGRQAVDYLADRTLRRVAVVVGAGVDPMQAYADACRRQGQSELVLLILQLAAQGAGQTPPDRPI